MVALLRKHSHFHKHEFLKGKTAHFYFGNHVLFSGKKNGFSILWKKVESVLKENPSH